MAREMFTLDHLNLQLLLEWQVLKIHGLIGARCGELHFVSHELYACNVDRFNYVCWDCNRFDVSGHETKWMHFLCPFLSTDHSVGQNPADTL